MLCIWRVEKVGDGKEEFCCDRCPVCIDAGEGSYGRGEGIWLMDL